MKLAKLNKADYKPVVWRQLRQSSQRKFAIVTFFKSSKAQLHLGQISLAHCGCKYARVNMRVFCSIYNATLIWYKNGKYSIENLWYRGGILGEAAKEESLLSFETVVSNSH